MVLPTCDTETRTDHQAADGSIVMQLIHFFELMGGIVDLEEEAVLTAHVYSLNLGPLLEGIGVVVRVFEVQDGENGVPGVVVQDDR